MDKPLPSNEAAETALIADIFQDNNIIAETIGTLKGTDFYYERNSVIYSKLVEMYKKNIPMDIITFSNSIGPEILKSIGGITYLTQIISADIGTSNYKQYIRIISELSNKRQIIKSCHEALNNAYSAEISSENITGVLEASLLNVKNSEHENKTLSASDLMQHTIDVIEEGYKNGGRIRGTTTGYDPIDKALNGLMKGDLVIIAGRPSMGKTALVLNMLNKLPAENKAALFELEMSEEKLGIRLLAPKVLINPQNLSKGDPSIDLNLIMTKAGQIANKDNIFINCKAGLTIGEIASEARRIKLRHNLDYIVVDHIGKIKPDNPRSSRNDQLGQISEGLKAMAKDLNIAVIALSQLNRSTEARPNKRPTMADLRESGNLEQDADAVMLLYRSDYYAERENRESSAPGIMEIMVAKNRDGQSGLIKLSYNTKYQVITEKPLF